MRNNINYRDIENLFASIDPSLGEDALLALSLTHLNASCLMCLKPYHSVWLDNGCHPCTQGESCASAFLKHGRGGSAFYGSGFDGDTFHVLGPHQARMCTLDPVCDRCIALMIIHGSIANLGDSHDSDSFGDSQHLSDSDARSKAHQCALDYFTQVAQGRGRPTPWRST